MLLTILAWVGLFVIIATVYTALGEGNRPVFFIGTLILSIYIVLFFPEWLPDWANYLLWDRIFILKLAGLVFFTVLFLVFLFKVAIIYIIKDKRVLYIVGQEIKFIRTNQTNRKHNLIILISTFTLLFMYANFIYPKWLSDYYNSFQQEQTIKSKEMEVNDFLKSMNPDLVNKINEIKENIEIANQKNDELTDLKNKFPDQNAIINEKIRNWENVLNTSNKALSSIMKKVETAYVLYKIDEMNGRKKFRKIEAEMFDSANATIEQAESMKNIVIESIDESN